ncbi:winged helix-turn-helix domain-containing protein [Aliiroseovarius sp. KMU-50]|uniref:Winged helix-turn-helix domain-containing protein n=1 Tax=Aliiroseovarius salicola TaxID=3009082 RepID=A0ABT4W5M1_9RHOB|nr:winged helix-turn-helix domain-containing protein [Aliiroseovarius sp. KMU-50]MDA5095765.1 winged helix-turn-helix domain-containing protein [Aliiroseovarius sp. KMU-50]
MSGENSEISAKSEDAIWLGRSQFLIREKELKSASGQTIRLRRQSTEVLAFLVSRAGHVVSKTALIENVWPDTFVTDDSLGQCIVDIRRVLEDTDHSILQTYPKKGYRLVPAKHNTRQAGIFSTKRRWFLPSIAAVALAVFAGIQGYFFTMRDTTDVASPALPNEPSLIVLPFDNQSGKSDLEYLAAGFSTSIRTQLSKFPQIFVIAGPTSMTFKNSPGTARGIGREMGVGYILDGSIHELGEGLSVNAELIDAASERTIWADQYDLSGEGALQAHTAIVEQIVSTLNVVVLEEEIAAVNSRPSESAHAYDLFMRAEAASNRLTRDGRLKSVELLTQAIELDPDYLAAHLELSGRYLSLYRFGAADDPEKAVRLARYHAEQALEISQSDYRSHFRMGMLHLFADQDHNFALAAFQRALEKNQNDADVLYNMGFLRSLMGDAAEAIEWNDKAKRVNPRYPGWYNFNAAQSRFFIGDYEEAETLARLGMAQYPTSLPPRRVLIATLVEMGRLEEARKEVDDYLKVSPDFRLSTFRNTPFQHDADRERYYNAMRDAGMPD